MLCWYPSTASYGKSAFSTLIGHDGEVAAYTSWVGGKVVAGTDGEAAPPRNETSGEMTMREDHDVGIVRVLGAVGPVLRLDQGVRYCPAARSTALKDERDGPLGGSCGSWQSHCRPGPTFVAGSLRASRHQGICNRRISLVPLTKCPSLVLKIDGNREAGQRKNKRLTHHARFPTRAAFVECLSLTYPRKRRTPTRQRPARS